MKILIATLDDKYFLPNFYNQILKAFRDSVAGICLFKTKPTNMSLARFVRMQLKMLGPVDFLKVISVHIKNSLFEKAKINPKGAAYTVVQLAKKYNLPIYRFKSINSKEMKDFIEKNQIDVLLCNIDEIIKDRILNIKGLICLNRHFGLLPKYRGLYPVYWALKNKEKFCGITIHKMNKAIDAGEIIEQEVVEISSGQKYLSLTKKCFDLSPQLVINALTKIKNGQKNWKQQDEAQQAYFSSP